MSPEQREQLDAVLDAIDKQTDRGPRPTPEIDLGDWTIESAAAEVEASRKSWGGAVMTPTKYTTGDSFNESRLRVIATATFRYSAALWRLRALQVEAKLAEVKS